MTDAHILLPEPWAAFLGELDVLLAVAPESRDATPVDLHCFGGFVIEMLYSLARSTSDIDVMTVRPSSLLNLLMRMAGRGSELAEKHGVYLDAQAGAVAHWPCDYETRLVEMFGRTFSRLRLFAPEVHDLALSKLVRNSDVDRDDIALLARAGLLRVSPLRERYETELRPYLLAGTEQRHDLTLELWTEMIAEIGVQQQ